MGDGVWQWRKSPMNARRTKFLFDKSSVVSIYIVVLVVMCLFNSRGSAKESISGPIDRDNWCRQFRCSKLNYSELWLVLFYCLFNFGSALKCRIPYRNWKNDRVKATRKKCRKWSEFRAVRRRFLSELFSVRSSFIVIFCIIIVIVLLSLFCFLVWIDLSAKILGRFIMWLKPGNLCVPSNSICVFYSFAWI